MKGKGKALALKKSRDKRDFESLNVLRGVI
jgi:hypothetical protein